MAIRQAIDSELLGKAKYEDFDGVEAIEGKILSKIHIHRERDRTSVENRKKQFLAKHGRLFCEACGFDFEKTFGKRGTGFIECHHTKPLDTFKSNQKTKLQDLALICANCHKMIHAKTDWLTMEELGQILNI